MTQSKSMKRKRNAQVKIPQKHIKITKTSSAAASLPDDEPFEIKRLQTVISDEELDITIDTLTTLAQYPSLTKSKLCRNLRTAVYEFRQSCTTGVNATTENANLTSRVSAALADEKYLEARILLAEMRLRGEEPKLGALCRWVRDLDVVTQPKGISIDNPQRSAKDDELLSVLDAVLRVSCPVDENISVTKPLPGSLSHIAFQATWDVRPPTKPQKVYESVLDKSIFASAPSSITHHKHPNVPNLSLATNVLSPDECKAIIAVGERVGFLPDTPIREGGDTSVLAHNFYWVIDTAFHDTLWSRISPFVPASVNGRLARGLNRRFRVYRYVPGAEYRCHIDGAWPPSGIRADDTYVYDDSPVTKKQSSLFTFLLYLNDEFEGGETTFSFQRR
ncbi:hypothetical protein TrVFT333_004599 [Trichoderma virens FT-333]|nr:hypothetical protein TrVFT333_004599 [Trichoderma virens FT-333]